jgi:5-methylcytosine-specific restriction endonuclease McrA
MFGHLDSAQCCYCHNTFDMEQLTIEHIVPLCLGGTSNPDNITLACKTCNQERGKEAWEKARQIRRKEYEH